MGAPQPASATTKVPGATATVGLGFAGTAGVAPTAVSSSGERGRKESSVEAGTALSCHLVPFHEASKPT